MKSILDTPWRGGFPPPSIERKGSLRGHPKAFIAAAIPFLLALGLVLSSTITGAASAPEAGSAVEADSSGNGSPDGPLKLDEAMHLAMERNPDLLAARQKLAVSRGRLLASGAFPNPELALLGAPALSGGDYRLSVGFDQEVPIGGRIGKRRDVAQSEFERDEALVQDLERRILGETRRSYRKVLVLTEKVVLAKDVADRSGEMIAVARSRFAKGEVSELDVRQFEIERSLRLQQLRTYATERTSALLELERSLGVAHRDDRTLADALEVPTDSLSLQPLLDAALTRPGVRSQESERQAAVGQLRLEKAQRWMDPTVGVFYSRERSSFTNPIPMEATDNFLGAAVRLPIPLFYGREGEMEEATARAEAARIGADVERGVAEREVRDAYQRTVSAARTYAESGEGLAAAEDAERLGRDAYAKGLVNAAQLFQVQGQLFTMKAARLDALDTYGRALSDLEEATGTPIVTAPDRGGQPSGEGRKP